MGCSFRRKRHRYEARTHRNHRLNGNRKPHHHLRNFRARHYTFRNCKGERHRARGGNGGNRLSYANREWLRIDEPLNASALSSGTVPTGVSGLIPRDRRHEFGGITGSQVVSGLVLPHTRGGTSLWIPAASTGVAQVASGTWSFSNTLSSVSLVTSALGTPSIWNT